MDDLRVPGVLDSDEALVRLALEGEEAAFARMVRLHRRAMVSACVVVTLDLDLALEAVAAAWPIAWSRLTQLEEPARLRPWLCAIAAREARDVVLYGSNRLVRPQDGAASRPASSSAIRRTDPELAGALDGLRPDDRVFLALRDVAGLRPEEVGQAVGATPEAVAAHTRGLARDVVARLPAAADGPPPAEALASRLRVLADVRIAHVDVDAVARVAKITRHDRRNRLVSLVVAGLLAMVVVAVPYLGESGPWPAWVAGMRAPWPEPSPLPSAEPAPNDLAAPH